MNFNEIKEDEGFTPATILETTLKPWSNLFGFKYDKQDLTPIVDQPKLPEQAEGIYRPEATQKALIPKDNPYKGMGQNNKFEFAFSGPIWRAKIDAVRCKDMHLSTGIITQYPTYIYSPLLINRDKNADETFLQAMSDLDAMITRGDMNFANGGRGNSYKYDCPFYLSFLKTQVVITLTNPNVIANMRQVEGTVPVKDFGVYCPFYSTAAGYHPMIYLNLEALRQDAEKMNVDVRLHYQKEMLRLLAYAFQDPTNSVDENGKFEKLYSKPNTPRGFQYSADEAEEFVNSYFNL